MMKEGVYIINSKSYQFIVTVTKTVYEDDELSQPLFSSQEDE